MTDPLWHDQDDPDHDQDSEPTSTAPAGLRPDEAVSSGGRDADTTEADTDTGPVPRVVPSGHGSPATGGSADAHGADVGASGGDGAAARGVAPPDLDDDDLRREMTHLHETRHDTVLGGTEDALQVHTTRMLALEAEFLRRFPSEAAPDPGRTRAGRR